VEHGTLIDILLIEDSPNDAELMIRAFRKQNIANAITIITDGGEALDFIFCRGAYCSRGAVPLPRVILLDLKLPKVSGLEILKAIKSEERLRMVPVVVVTSSQEDPDITTAYALGANSYVVKPVSSSAFIEAMSNLGLYWVLVNRPPIA
jgi:two-component system response regulator